MPGEIIPLPLGIGNTGLAIYGVLYNPVAKVWDGDSFETYGTAARNAGAILAAEQGVTGTYLLTVPAGVTAFGEHRIAWFKRLGGVGVYAITDPDYGTSYFRVGDTLLDLDAAFFRIRNAGSGGAVEYENADGSVRFTAVPASTNGAFAGVTRP